MCHPDIAANGWTAVPVDAGAIFTKQPLVEDAKPVSLEELRFPAEDLVVSKTVEYAKAVLDPETFNHSMRVYYFGKRAGSPAQFSICSTHTYQP